MAIAKPDDAVLLSELRGLIDQARQYVSKTTKQHADDAVLANRAADPTRSAV